MERRRFERVPFHQRVMLEDSTGRAHLADACDVSLGGMFVAGARVALGSRVVLHVHAGSGDDWTMALEGVVRWTGAAGAGIHFDDLDARETGRIRDIVIRAAPSRTRERAAAPTLELELDELERQAARFGR